LLIATTDFPPGQGGIQRLLSELATRLTARWRITVVAPADPTARLSDETSPFRVLRTRHDWREARFGVLAEMALAVARTGADVLLAGHLNVLPSLVIGAPGKPKAVILHGSELWARRTRVVARLLGRRVQCAMAVSKFTALEAGRAGIDPRRTCVTPLGATRPTTRDGMDILDALGLVRHGRVVPFFVTVSRIDEPHKGHDVFIRALPALRESQPDLEYVIAGEGKLAQSLYGLAVELGVAGAVRMLGLIDEATKDALLTGCRAFVMVSSESRKPALFEGFGIVYLEAALAGRPSLAGAAGGVGDAVVHEETGLMVDPLSVGEVTKAALRLLEDPQFADALGRRARARAQRDFTWEVAIARMERCLEAMLP
jgi:phosphatidylinositol alpha-1,6-mannosyltransferase